MSDKEGNNNNTLANLLDNASKTNINQNELIRNKQDEKEIIEIETDSVTSNPFQPRKIFDDKKLRELSESIVEHGLLQPINVVLIDGVYILISGERRLKAHELAGIDTIKAIISHQSSDKKLKELSIIENLQREDLNCVEEAIAFNGLKESGYSIRITADKLGKSRNYIHSRLNLLNFASYDLEYIATHKLFNLSFLAEILLCDKKKHTKLLERYKEDSLSLKELKSMNKPVEEKEKEKEKKANTKPRPYPYGLAQIEGVGFVANRKKIDITINLSELKKDGPASIQKHIAEILRQINDI